MSDYMILQLKQDESTVFITFAIVSITGPVLGVVIGGNITTKLGGYSTYTNLVMTCGAGLFCALVAAPVVFINQFFVFTSLVWLLLFFGGFILPSMTGIMLNTVDSSLKTSANSLAYLSYNLFGYLPAPSVYGWIYDYGDGGNAKTALGALMFMPVFIVGSFITAAYIIKRDKVLGF